MSEDVLNRLRSYKGVSILKKAGMNLLMKTATEKEVELLREMFMKIDTDGTGLIHASELRDIIL